MHELAFAEQILSCVLDEAQKYNARRIKFIRLRAGELLGIEPDSLMFCLDAITAGTMAEGVSIKIDTSGPEVSCEKCGRLPVSGDNKNQCPKCGGRADYLPATGLYVETIEIEDDSGEGD